MQSFAISNKILFCFLGVCVFAMLSCKKESSSLEIAMDEEDFGYIEPAVEQFRESSADPKVDYKTAVYFSRASFALLSMGQEWAERMDHANEDDKLRLAASYEKAQDEMIRKFGIKGKEEFEWLQTKALLMPENREAFARAGIWIGKQ